MLKQHAPNHKAGQNISEIQLPFGKFTHVYLRITRWIKNNGGKGPGFTGLLCVAIWYLFRIMPSGLVPNEDQGYILGMGILDDGASLNRTVVVGDVIKDYALKDRDGEAACQH